jgi:DNA-binding response OmpR family regulator
MVMIGNALESDVNTFLNAGADSVLINPFSMDEFTSAMASVAIRMAKEMPTSSVATDAVLEMHT